MPIHSILVPAGLAACCPTSDDPQSLILAGVQGAVTSLFPCIILSSVCLIHLGPPSRSSSSSLSSRALSPPFGLGPVRLCIILVPNPATCLVLALPCLAFGLPRTGHSMYHPAGCRNHICHSAGIIPQDVGDWMNHSSGFGLTFFPEDTHSLNRS